MLPVALALTAWAVVVDDLDAGNFDACAGVAVRPGDAKVGICRRWGGTSEGKAKGSRCDDCCSRCTANQLLRVHNNLRLKSPD